MGLPIDRDVYFKPGPLVLLCYKKPEPQKGQQGS